MDVVPSDTAGDIIIGDTLIRTLRKSERHELFGENQKSPAAADTLRAGGRAPEQWPRTSPLRPHCAGTSE